VSHLAFGLLLAERAALKQEWDADWAGDDRAPYLRGVPEAEWADRAAEQGAATARAWSDPHAWEGEVPFGGSPMPAAAVGLMMTAEFVVHGWDVAASSGQRIDVPPPLGEAVLEDVEAIAPMGREGGWFAPEVTVAADASALEKALAASGRDPAWTP
jgi:uncharacterized protein (TIGR03086 family)